MVAEFASGREGYFFFVRWCRKRKLDNAVTGPGRARPHLFRGRISSFRARQDSSPKTVSTESRVGARFRASQSSLRTPQGVFKPSDSSGRGNANALQEGGLSARLGWSRSVSIQACESGTVQIGLRCAILAFPRSSGLAESRTGNT